MNRFPPFDPVPYLVARKFPNYKAIEDFPSSLGNIPRISMPGTFIQEQKQKIADFRAELASKSPDELLELTKQEQQKESQDFQQSLDREEQQRFFNQPHARADSFTGASARTGRWTRLLRCPSARRPKWCAGRK